MLEKKELSSLITQLISIKLLLSYPRKIILNSANAAWIQILLSGIAAFILFWLCMKFYDRKESIIDIAGRKWKRIGKVIVGLAVFFSLFTNLLYVMRIFPESVKIVLLQNFDGKVLILIFALSILLGASMGIEAAARINYIFLPIAGVVMIGFFLLLAPNYRLFNIAPLFGNGMEKIAVGSISSLSIFSDLLLLNIIIPYSKDLESVRKSGYKAIAISTAAGIIILIAYVMVYPYPVSGEFVMPVYQLTRIINIGKYFNRFEALFEFVWAILMLLYGAVYLFVLCHVWQSTFNLKYKKPLLLPITLLATSCALIPKSVSGIIEFSDAAQDMILPVVFILPIIMSVLSKRKGGIM